MINRSVRAPRRVVLWGVLGVAVATVVGSSIWAQSTPNLYTGCLGGGIITNVKIGTSPVGPCSKQQTQISWNAQGPPGANGQSGPPGADGQPGPPGADGKDGQPGLSRVFWSARTTGFLNAKIVETKFARTGPLPSGKWLTVTGQLDISATGSGLGAIACAVYLAPPGGLTPDGFGGQVLATLLPPGGSVDAADTPKTIPIRFLVDATAAPDDYREINIQCSGIPEPTVNFTLRGDLLVIPTEEGTIGHF